MRVAIVVAVSRNGVIGRDGGLPWRLPGDLRRFRALTLGRPLVMGRRTWESIGRPLPGRASVVISRSLCPAPDGVDVVPDFAAALRRAANIAGDGGPVFVIGGAAVYRAALPHADVVYMTEVDAEVEGTVTFPLPLGAEWREMSRERHAAVDGDEHAYRFVTLERAAPG